MKTRCCSLQVCYRCVRGLLCWDQLIEFRLFNGIPPVFSNSLATKRCAEWIRIFIQPKKFFFRSAEQFNFGSTLASILNCCIYISFNPIWNQRSLSMCYNFKIWFGIKESNDSLDIYICPNCRIQLKSNILLLLEIKN